MAKETHHITYEVFTDPAELPAGEASLLEQAAEAAGLAYAPFSGFSVGCALLLEDGEVILGNNQENKAYPSAMCAERTALYFAGSLGKGAKIRKIAIRGFSESKDVTQPVTPCGACRQAMLEYEQLAGTPFVVLMQGASGSILRVGGIDGALLPFGFNIEF
ncbi:MAG: cytidine deaminase [Bacteroidia bacterium]|nr:cytidine deaminase [Bacteroidia bacterium]